MMERRVIVDGCHNFRDLGGYPTTDGGALRWRQLFRADGLHSLSSTGIATVRDELKLGDIVDLRSSYELEIDGRGPLADEPIRFHHLPLFDSGNTGQRQRPIGTATCHPVRRLRSFPGIEQGHAEPRRRGGAFRTCLSCCGEPDRTGCVFCSYGDVACPPKHWSSNEEDDARRQR
jgi:hypothetical protein